MPTGNTSSGDLFENNVRGVDSCREDATCGVGVEAGRGKSECFSVAVVGVANCVADRCVGFGSDASGIDVECAVGLPALGLPTGDPRGGDFFEDNVRSGDISGEDPA